MSETPLAERLADYAASLSVDDLDEQTISLVKARIIDALACAYAGHEEEPVQATLRYARRKQGDRNAALIGGGTASVEAAALANGVSIRYLDWNDTYLAREPGHPSDNLGAVLAVADAYDCSGMDLVLATTLAYELQCRLCDAASLKEQGFDHVNYGLVSATLAAGKLMALDREELCQAVNIALTGHIALRQARAGELTEWKGMAFGNVDRNAVVAAELAAEGIDGPAPIFEGTFGFFEQVTGPFDLDVSTFGGNDESFKIHETLVKYYPVEYHAQTAVECALAIREALDVDPDEVERIVCETYDEAISIIAESDEKWRPGTRETADHSLPYCVARPLIDGEMTLAQFDSAKYTDPAVRDLMDLVEVRAVDEFNEQFGDGYPHRLTVETTDGTDDQSVRYPKGHPENPLSEAEQAAKFETGCAGVLSEADRAGLLEALRSLETLTDLSPLTEHFSPV